MYSTPGGDDVKLQLAPSHAHITPQGPKHATPLSPSLTDEVDANENRALPSTANDELFAWLLQHKVDDEKIANYLCERDIDLSELSELENDQLKDLLKDIEEDSGTKIQMIDKNRFMKACRKLRPQQRQPQPQPQPHHSMLSQASIPPQHAQHAPHGGVIHRGSHFQYPPPAAAHPYASPLHAPHDPNQLISQPYGAPHAQPSPYSTGPPPHPQVRHLSMTSNQQPVPQPPQPPPQYYHPPNGGPPVAVHHAHAYSNPPAPQQNPNHRGYYGHVAPQQQYIMQQQQNKASPSPQAQYGQHPHHQRGSVASNQHRASANRTQLSQVMQPLPDEYKAQQQHQQKPPQQQRQQSQQAVAGRHNGGIPQKLPDEEEEEDEITTKGLFDDLDKEFKDEHSSNHNKLNTNTKSSNLVSGSELGSNLGGASGAVEESQNSSGIYSAVSREERHERGNNATMIQHNLQIHHRSANSASHSNSGSGGNSPHIYSNHSQSGGDNHHHNKKNHGVSHSEISAMAPSMITDSNKAAAPAVAAHAANNNNAEFDRNRAISVMTDIPQIQHETIFLQLNRFNNKDDLKNELYSVITRLKKEIKAHKLRIDSFTKTLDKLKAKHAKQMDQWNKWYIVELKYLGNEYFNALFKFLSTQIQIEYTYIECFSEKLKRLTKAHDSVNTNIHDWDMRKLQEFVKDTIVTVTKMKVSSSTISKKKALENVKKNIGSLQKEYEKAKQLLATPRCDHTVRQQTIVYFFNTVTNDYNEKNDNLVLTTTYFCEEHLQEKFNSFILDQRCQIHTMYVKQWLSNISKNRDKDIHKISIKSIYQFIENLIHKFSKLYQIDKVTTSYYYYVERFAYICIISIPQIDDILALVLNSQKGQKEHAKLANKHQYQLFCKLLDAKYLSNANQ